MIWEKCLRSPYAHARIRSINTIAAKNIADDLPRRLVGRRLKDMPVLAQQRCASSASRWQQPQPADLPVEKATKLGVVFNLKTAEKIRLTIPQKVLAGAIR